MVLALTDSGVIEGVYLYNMFRSEDFLKAMNVFKFNFALAKEELGIHGEYVERAGDIFSEDFNPKRNKEVLKLSGEELEEKGKEVYEAIFSEIKKIVKSALSKNKS